MGCKRGGREQLTWKEPRHHRLLRLHILFCAVFLLLHLHSSASAIAIAIAIPLTQPKFHMELHPPPPSVSSSSSSSSSLFFPLFPSSKWCPCSSSPSPLLPRSPSRKFSSHLRLLLRRLKSSLRHHLHHFSPTPRESFLYDPHSYAMNFDDDATCFHRKTFSTYHGHNDDVLATTAMMMMVVAKPSRISYSCHRHGYSSATNFDGELGADPCLWQRSPIDVCSK